ncbi:ABC transporter ATP-binding protein [Oceanobacillus piezotolerans]|uniref:ABC transporter ATP-binding protein n=1 Tax=Oceanobacillus piezotolerans TaxID=2448030 RepID=A0A498DHD2_9BACI|nr:ABC transporter ATP-binding protein [Oceanobacillus piezotolerans]RLL44895.1 ABC transporter ATP-binding protein [Oceanobacillus piezotolerans]
MSEKIKFDGVSKVFRLRDSQKKNATREFTAVKDLNFTVKDGEFLTVVGPSGCGKSTLLDMLGGLIKPTTGRVLLNGTPIEGPGLERGVVFQQYALFPWKTALANIEFGLEAKKVPKKERQEKAQEYLALVGLSEFAYRYPHELSGGMKQRVAIARSLAYDPEVLLMDEPFAALDAQTRESLQEELLQIWEKTKKTIVFITHGIDEAVYLGQRVAVMTSRPGTLKGMIDISFDSRTEEGDLRSTPEFTVARHQVWTLLSEEVNKTRYKETLTV